MSHHYHCNEECDAGDIFIFIHCSDGGPDQMRSKKIINCELIRMPTILYIETKCAKHAGIRA